MEEEQGCELPLYLDTYASEAGELLAPGWDHPSHMFTSCGDEYIHIQDYRQDLLLHMASAIEKQLPEDVLASLVAEALIMQAAIFPIFDDKSRLCFGGWNPVINSGDGGSKPLRMTSFFDMGHFYGQGPGMPPGRIIHNLSGSVNVARLEFDLYATMPSKHVWLTCMQPSCCWSRGGKIIKLTYKLINDGHGANWIMENCMCKWCSTVQREDNELQVYFGE